MDHETGVAARGLDRSPQFFRDRRGVVAVENVGGGGKYGRRAGENTGEWPEKVGAWFAVDTELHANLTLGFPQTGSRSRRRFDRTRETKGPALLPQVAE